MKKLYYLNVYQQVHKKVQQNKRYYCSVPQLNKQIHTCKQEKSQGEKGKPPHFCSVLFTISHASVNNRPYCCLIPTEQKVSVVCTHTQMVSSLTGSSCPLQRDQISVNRSFYSHCGYSSQKVKKCQKRRHNQIFSFAIQFMVLITYQYWNTLVLLLLTDIHSLKIGVHILITL